MWLLNTSTLKLHQFRQPNVPPYAILSHTVKDEEIKWQDIESSLMHLKPKSYEKIKTFCELAKLDGLSWIWVGTCCINVTDPVELTETLNAEYTWCEQARVCYVYLSDVTSSPDGWIVTLRASGYFDGKFTLQELIAPPSVIFFANDWKRIGTRQELNKIISEITGIPSAVLGGEKKSKQCHISERIAWAASRSARIVEDEAYSLLGLFDVEMPIRYGEGARASQRLEEAIRNKHYASGLDLTTSSMRLLITRSKNLKLVSFPANRCPEYAILSHTWRQPEDEVLYTDVCQGDAQRKRYGYQKVKKSCELAARHGFQYLWVDTCCIDKTSSAELQEAICSMFRWYKVAQICYVYLEDCDSTQETTGILGSRWFTRGWTLQELIAPKFVEFYDKNWLEIGTKLSLCKTISEITRIDPAVLRGSDIFKHTIAERMSWAASRSTTRIEDTAYSLMGLFNVFMPMLYGESRKAFSRLQEEIMKQSDDYTIFAWRAPTVMGHQRRGIFAHSPAEFSDHTSSLPKFVGYRQEQGEFATPPTMTSKGLLLDLPLRRTRSGNNQYIAWVCSSQSKHVADQEFLVCILLQNVPPGSRNFVRIAPEWLGCCDAKMCYQFKSERIYMQPHGSVAHIGAGEMGTEGSGVIMIDGPEGFESHLALELWREEPQNGGVNMMNFMWTYKPKKSQLEYWSVGSSHIPAALAFERDDVCFVVMLGFHEHLPWCSVATLEETKQSPLLRERIPDLSQRSANWSDRSSKLLAGGSKATASIRIGSTTPSSHLNVFNLEVGYFSNKPIIEVLTSNDEDGWETEEDDGG